MVDVAFADSVRGATKDNASIPVRNQGMNKVTAENDDEKETRKLTLGYGYDGYHDRGCRTHDNGLGREGYDYDRYHGYSHHECESLCNSMGHRCQAYETKSGGHCEVWYFYPPKTGYASGLACYKKNSSGGGGGGNGGGKSSKHDDYYYDTKRDKFCRTAHGGRGVEGHDYDKYRHHSCKQLCDELGHRCQAYESGPNNHCEIWKYAPPGSANGHGYKCALKYYY